jgi:hypothetical protein
MDQLQTTPNLTKAKAFLMLSPKLKAINPQEDAQDAIFVCGNNQDLG